MRALPTLSRSWPFTELPGYREHPDQYSTYSDFAYDALPPIEHELDDDFRWLLAEPALRYSLVTTVFNEYAATPATSDGLHEVIGSERLLLPPAFLAFIGSDEPRARIRSCTGCYLDLGERATPVSDGGFLVQFLLDSQWVLNWALYIGPDQSEAVVATGRPIGFSEDADQAGPDWFETFVPGQHEAVVCAESFSEFIYRFWIENEIWHRSAKYGEPDPLTPEQQRYAEHYLRPVEGTATRS